MSVCSHDRNVNQPTASVEEYVLRTRLQKAHSATQYTDVTKAFFTVKFLYRVRTVHR